MIDEPLTFEQRKFLRSLFDTHGVYNPIGAEIEAVQKLEKDGLVEAVFNNGEFRGYTVSDAGAIVGRVIGNSKLVTLIDVTSMAAEAVAMKNVVQSRILMDLLRDYHAHLSGLQDFVDNLLSSEVGK